MVSNTFCHKILKIKPGFTNAMVQKLKQKSTISTTTNFSTSGLHVFWMLAEKGREDDHFVVAGGGLLERVDVVLAHGVADV